MSDDLKRCCAVCPKPIKPGFLMCWAHWQMVPPELARQVYSALGYLSRAPRADRLFAARDYSTKRQAAIDSVQQQLAARTPAEGPTP